MTTRRRFLLGASATALVGLPARAQTLNKPTRIIVGAAAPITFDGGSHETAALLYFSYELPFTSNR